VHLCKGSLTSTVGLAQASEGKNRHHTRPEEAALDRNPTQYSPQQGERLALIHARLIEARRELDALIGDAYLRPRASIVPVHFLDLAAAAEKLRWAEKEWRELDKEMADPSDLHIVEFDSAST
jgi:hypothetical protein